MTPSGEYIFNGAGHANLECETGEVRTASGCEKLDDIPSRRRVKVPNERSCGADTVGNPVEVSSGRKLDSQTDFATAGSFALKLERFYRAPSALWVMGAERTSIGQNWATNFDVVGFWSLYPYGSFRFQLPDGRDYAFRVNGSDQVIPQYFSGLYGSFIDGNVGNDANFAWFADRVELTVDGEVTYVFNLSRQLTTIRYRGGYEQALLYNAKGQRTSVTDNLGRTAMFTYDAHGYVSEIATPDGRAYKYRYKTTVNVSALEAAYPTTDFTHQRNLRNVLETVILPDDTPGTDADNPVVTYHYENASTPTLLTGVTDERGIRYASWSYDALNRATSSTHAGGADNTTLAFDDANNRVTVTTALGKQAVYNFAVVDNSARRLTSILGLATANCPSSTQSFTYDANSFVASVTDEEGRVTAYLNDARGRATSVTRGSGSATPSTVTTSWHALWNVPTQVVEPGRTTDYAWNALGQLETLTQTDTTGHTMPYPTAGQTRSWTYTYGTAGLLLTVDGPLSGSGDTVTFSYDTLGYVKTITDEVGHVMTVDSVNGRGQPTLMTDANGIKTAMSYDARGRLLTVSADSAGAGAATTMEYDAIGQITRVTQANGSWRGFIYDDARRLIKVTANSGETIDYVRDAIGGATSITRKKADGTMTFARTQTFDELGRLLRSIGANSSTWGFAYDRTGNLTEVTDPRANLYSYGFDALNRLISETNEDNELSQVTRNGVDAVTSHTDPRGLVTAYLRNGFGEVIQAVSPDSGTVVYQRDPGGRITQKTDGRGVVTNQSFDDAGRITARSFPSASGETVSWSYDDATSGNKGKGRLTGMSDASGTTAWTYDARGNVLSETRVIASRTYVVSYAYDLADKVTQMTYPSGRVVSFSRDATGRVGGVTTKQNAAAASTVLAAWVAYQPFGDLQSLRYGNDLSLWRTFTADDQLDMLLVENTTTGTALIKRFHDRTDNGLNLTNIYAYDDVSPPPHQSFWYSASRRLQEASGLWGQFVYYYGPGGNRTYEILTQGGTTTEKVTSYGAVHNRAIAVTTGGVATRSFGYDGAGNIVSDMRGNAAWSFTHNAAGRLSAASVGGVAKGAYSYDGLERLAIRTVSNTTPSGTIHLVYDTGGGFCQRRTASPERRCANMSGLRSTTRAWSAARCAVRTTTMIARAPAGGWARRRAPTIRVRGRRCRR